MRVRWKWRLEGKQVYVILSIAKEEGQDKQHFPSFDSDEGKIVDLMKDHKKLMTKPVSS